jgi:hypothetical protein
VFTARYGLGLRSALVAQHKLSDVYNRDEKCLQRGTDWAFKVKRSVIRLLKVKHTRLRDKFCVLS